MVVGGGEVAWCKVNTLLEQGACVTVISQSFYAGLTELAEHQKIRAIIKAFEPEDIKGAFVVIAATDDNNVNEQVAREARKNKSLVNVVDNADLSDFIVPAFFTRGDLTVAVSTAGKSPALARRVKQYLEQYLGREYAAITDLAAEVRAEIKARGIKVDEDAWQKALDTGVFIFPAKKRRKEPGESDNSFETNRNNGCLSQ